MSVSSQQLYDFLKHHKGEELHAEIEMLKDERSCVTLFDKGIGIDWSESDASIPTAIQWVEEMGFTYHLFSLSPV